MREGIGTVTSLSAASISWLSTFNEVVQILAGLVSVAAGLIVVIPWLIKRVKK